LHDVINGTDLKENNSTKQTAKKTLVTSIVARLLVARQRPSSVDFVGPQCARHNISIYNSLDPPVFSYIALILAKLVYVFFDWNNLNLPDSYIQEICRENLEVHSIIY
jgi:hypothetical protein